MVEFIAVVILLIIFLPFVAAIVLGIGYVLIGILLFVGSIIKGASKLSR